MKYVKRISIFIVFSIIFLMHNVYAEDLPEKFDLREHITIEVRDQKDTNTCWAFSATSLLSTHLAYLNNENYTFSPRHMEYVMSKDSIIDKENKYAYMTKNLDIGGNEDVIKQYFAQGTGPVLEKNMPFKNDCSPINEEELPLGISYKQVTEAAHILPMYKEWENGNLVYKDYAQRVLSDDEVKIYQNSVKSAIKEYGGVDATIAFDDSGFDFINGSFNTKETTNYWHSILLIGWDDNYSRENFREEVRPMSDGAYIALNSWGDILGDNGYMYISYEDVSLDLSMKTYIKKVEDVDYDNVYYNDLSIAKQNGETLTELTLMVDARITGFTYVNLKVDGDYVINNALLDDCIENYILETPIELKSDTEILLEISVSDNIKNCIHPYYYTVTNSSKFEMGKISSKDLDEDCKEIYLYTKHNTIDNGKKVDIEIFKNGEDHTSEFCITGNTIKNKQTGITISQNEVSDGEYLMKLIYNNQEKRYKFTVSNGVFTSIEQDIKDDVNVDLKGDVSLDGRVSSLDLSQLKAYIVGTLEFTERSRKACDINGDGNVTALDVSVLKDIIVSLR